MPNHDISQMQLGAVLLLPATLPPLPPRRPRLHTDLLCVKVNLITKSDIAEYHFGATSVAVGWGQKTRF